MATHYTNGGLIFKTNTHTFKTGDNGTTKYKIGVPLPPNIILPSNTLNIPSIPSIPSIPTPPAGPSTYYGNIYVPDQKETPSYIVNPKDPYEMNSMVDILLSSMNPNMKHHYDKIDKVKEFARNPFGILEEDNIYIKHPVKDATLEYAARVLGNTWGHMQQHYFYEGAGENWAGLFKELPLDLVVDAAISFIPYVGPAAAISKFLFWDLPQGESAPIATNLLTDVGEVMDIFTAPIRATAQTITDPLFENTGINISDEVPTGPNMLGNIGKALVQSTIGDEGGRKNFDWEIDTPMADAGDFILNFGLELVFDFDNLVQRATKGSVKGALKVDPDELQKQANKFYNSLTETDKAEILNLMKRKNLIASADNTERAIKQTYITSLVQHINKNYIGGSNTDTLNNLNKMRNKTKLFKDVTTTNLRNELNESFVNIYLQNFTTRYDKVDLKDLKKVLEKSLKDYSDITNDMLLNKLSTNIISSLGLKVNSAVSGLNSHLLNIGLLPSGVTPSKWILNKSFKKIQEVVKKGNTINKQTGGFMKAGPTKGVLEEIVEQSKTQKAFLDKSQYNNQTLLDTNIKVLASSIDELIKEVELCLKDSQKRKDAPQVVRNAIINKFQVISAEYKISLDNLITDLKGVIDYVKNEYGTGILTNVGLESQVKELERLYDVVYDYLPNLQSQIDYKNRNISRIENANTISNSYHTAKTLESTGIFEDPMTKHSGNTLINLFKEYTKLDTILSSVNDLKNLINTFNNFKLNPFTNDIFNINKNQIIQEILNNVNFLKILQETLNKTEYNNLIKLLDQLKNIDVIESLKVVPQTKKSNVYDVVHLYNFEDRKQVVELMNNITTLLNKVLQNTKIQQQRYNELNKYFNRYSGKKFELQTEKSIKKVNVLDILNDIKNNEDIISNLKTIRTSTIANTTLHKKFLEAELVLKEIEKIDEAIENYNLKINGYEPINNTLKQYKYTRRIKALQEDADFKILKRLKKEVIKEADPNKFLKKYGEDPESVLHIKNIKDTMFQLNELKKEILSSGRYLAEPEKLDDLLNNISSFIKLLNQCSEATDEEVLLAGLQKLNNLKNSILNDSRPLDKIINGVNRLASDGADTEDIKPLGKTGFDKELDFSVEIAEGVWKKAIDLELEIIQDRASKDFKEYIQQIKKDFKEHYPDKWKKAYATYLVQQYDNLPKRSNQQFKDQYKAIINNVKDSNEIYNEIIVAVEQFNITPVVESYLAVQDVVAIHSLKYDQHFVKDTLNNLPSLQTLFTDPILSDLVDNYERYNNIKPDDLEFLKKARFIKLTLQNYQTFMQDIDKFVDTLPKEDLPKYNNLKAVIVSVIENYERKEVNNLKDVDKIVEDVYERINSIESTLSPEYNSLKLDVLLNKYEITDSMIKQELAKVKFNKNEKIDITGLKRHDDLYDTMAQILVTEKIYGTDFKGIMYDIETTGTNPERDNIISITALMKDENKNYTCLYSKTIKGKSINEIQEYLPMSNVIESMSKSQKDFINSFIDPNESITQQALVMGFYEAMINNKNKLTMYSFNGSRFDDLFLNVKGERFTKGLDLNAFTEFLKVRNLLPAFQVLKEKKTLKNVLSEYGTPIDVLQDLTKNRYVLPEKYKTHLTELINNQLIRTQSDAVRSLADDIKYKNVFLGGITGDIITDLRNTLDELIKEEDIEKSLNKKAPSIRTVDVNAMDTSGIDNALLEASEGSAVSTKAKMQTKTLIEDAYKKLLNDLSADIRDEQKAVKIFNEYFKAHPIFVKRRADGSEYLDLDENTLTTLNNLIKANIATTNPELAKNMSDITFSNVLQILFMGDTEYPTYMSKKFSVDDARAILDISEKTIKLNNYGKIDNFLRAIKNNYETITNYQTLIEHEDIINNALEFFKKSNLRLETNLIKLDTINIREKYAVLKTIIDKVDRSSKSNIASRVRNEKALKKAYETVPGLKSFVDKGLAHYSVNTDTDIPIINNYQNYRINTPYLNDTASEEIQDLKAYMLKHSMQKSLKESQTMVQTASKSLKAMEHTVTVAERINKVFDMYDQTYDKLGNPTKATRHLKNTDRMITRVLSEKHLNNILRSPLDVIQRYVIDSGSAHTVTFKIPSANIFNNRDYFNHFIKLKKELKDQYHIKLDIDEANQRVTLSMTDDVVIKFNKDRTTRKTYYDIDGELHLGYTYTLNGKPMYHVLYDEISLEDLQNIIGSNPEYIKAVWEARQDLMAQNPLLSGRLGLTNYKERYEKVFSDQQIMPVIKNKKQFTEEQATYFNDWAIGDIDSIKDYVPGMTLDYINILGMLGKKQIEHSHSYQAYGQFIMQSGLGIDSPILQDMSIEEITEYLKAKPNLTLVYLENNKNAIGNFTLRKLNSYNPKIVKDILESGGKIVDWNTYEAASEAINKFSYSFEDNLFYKVIRKLTSFYKIGTLLNGTGPFIRNVLDSNMKNLFEGQSVRETISTTVQSFNVLYKYNEDLKNIRKMNPYKKFSLADSRTYFQNHKTHLDQETFDFVYNFTTRNGANSINTGLQSLIDLGMFPNRWLEDTVRFAQYTMLMKKGLPDNEIIRRITQTHFNYNNKTLLGNPDLQVLNIKPLNFGLKIDDIIPFYTYTISNVSYIAHLLAEKPHLIEAYLDFFETIYNLEDYDFEEYANNPALQYQFINGNIPLKYLIYGWEDKKVTRTVNTKYGPKEQEVINTAVLKTGSSLLDGMYMLYDPKENIIEKTSPGIQFMIDSIRDYKMIGWGSIDNTSYNTKEEVDDYFDKNFGSTSVQKLIRLQQSADITNEFPYRKSEELDKAIASLLPFGNMAMNHKYKVPQLQERTDNNILASMPSVFGATARWGEFKQEPRKTYSYPTTYKSAPKSVSYYNFNYNRSYPTSYRVNHKGQSVKYYLRYPQKTYYTGKTPYTAYSNMLRRIYSPNTAHRFASNNISSNMQTIPQYLYSYYGKNRQGKSKILSWMRMNSRYKVKSTLRRIASP